MKKKLLTCVLLATANGVPPIAAADILFLPESEGLSYTWSGPYVGFQAGGVMSSIKGSKVLLGALQVQEIVTTSARGSLMSDKQTYNRGHLGLYAGYNALLASPLLIGVEADFATGPQATLPKVKQQVVSAEWGPDFDPKLEDASFNEEGTQLTYNSSAALRLRLGMTAGRVLGYVAGGVSLLHGIEKPVLQDEAYTDMKRKYAAKTNASGVTDIAWLLGGGLEFALGPTIVLRGEYRYTRIAAKPYVTSVKFELVPDDRTKNPETLTADYGRGESWNHDWRVGIAAKF